MKNKKIALCMMICMISVLQGTQEYLMELLDEALLLLDELQHNTHAYIPRIYNKELAYLLQDLSEEQIIEALQMAESFDNNYLLNGVAAVLVDQIFVTGSVQRSDLQNKLSPKTYSFVEKYVSLKKGRGPTRACGDIDISVADYVSQFDVPLEYLGSVGILRFDDKNLTSLYGIQDLSYIDVGIATFSGNCIQGSNLDPQFPSNAFQNLPNLAWLHLGDNSIAVVPSTFFNSGTNLTRINLSDNQFLSIPTGLFANLDEVGYLDFSFNLALATIPSTSFQDMSSLSVLLLNNNVIASISSSLFANNNLLQVIDLSNNLLLTWPASALNGLTELKYLNLANNLLIDFSPNSLPDGSTVILTGNALTVLQELTLQVNFPEVNFTF